VKGVSLVTYTGLVLSGFNQLIYRIHPIMALIRNGSISPQPSTFEIEKKAHGFKTT
jgi:hypothetical protein